VSVFELENQMVPEMPEETLEQKLSTAKSRIAGSVPLIPDAPDCVVDLPRGIFHAGEWHTEAEVRELTGSDEESLARVRETVDFFDQILALGVVRIGTIRLADMVVGERQAYLSQLLLGERSQLLLAVVRATYGDDKTIGVTCPACEHEQEIDLILSVDFKPKEVDDLQQASYSYKAKSWAITYRLVTGGDQSAALSRKGSTVAEQNSIILSRCILSVNGEILPDPLGFARKLGMKDRTKLLSLMVEKQPDIDLSLKVPCIGCGGEMTLGLGWGDLFRP
jgi:hypothetical protein